MFRYARLLWIQFRASLLLAMQYRVEFFLDALISLFWTGTVLVPLFVVFSERTSVAGWSFGECLVVIGWFTLLEGVLDGAINPSLATVVDHIRKGTLDFVLIKPADAQFLVSTSRFLVWKAMNFITALVIFGYAFTLLGRWPSWLDMLQALVMLVFAVGMLYSMWILVISAAFYVVRIDNLSHFFSAVFDAARWPVQVFRGVVQWIFTFVIPLAIMTTYPAEALLGRASVVTILTVILGAGVFAICSRFIWLRSLANYSSASS